MSGVWLWVPMAGPIRISTILGAFIVFAAMAIIRRDPIGGVIVVVAWTSAFEIVFRLVGIVGYHWPLEDFVWATAAVAGWVILASALGYWPDRWLTAAFVVAMVVWIAFGFHYNVAGQAGAINVRDEVLNEAAKSLLGLAYLVGALRGSDREASTGAMQKDLMKDLIDRDRGHVVVRRRLQFGRIGSWLNWGGRVIPHGAIGGIGPDEVRRSCVVETDNAPADISRSRPG